MSDEIVSPELSLLRALCRKPQLVVNIPSDILNDLTPNSKPSLIIQEMFRLHKGSKPVTLQAVAESGIETLDNLRKYSSDCPVRLLRDDEFRGVIALTRMYGLKRRLEKFFQQGYNQVVMATPLKIQETFAYLKEEISLLDTLGMNEGTSVLEDIVMEYYDPTRVTTPGWRIKTGITWIDRLTGGIGKNKMWVLYGQFKNGKTQLLRAIVDNISFNLYRKGEGHKVVHIAHDGGDKYVHSNYYLAMRIQKFLMEHVQHDGTPFPIWGKGQDRDGVYSDRLPLITPYNVEAVRRTRNMSRDELEKTEWRTTVRIPPEVQQVIHDKLDEMETSQVRNLIIYDATTIHHDIDRMLSIFEREFNNGARVFVIDHAGEIGDPRSKLWERTAINAQILANFVREHDCCMIVLSQINRTGINDKESGGANLAGGDDLIVKADMAFKTELTGPSGNKRIQLSAPFARFSEGGRDVMTELIPFLASGLITEDAEEEGDYGRPDWNNN